MFGKSNPAGMASLVHAAAVNGAATGDATAPARKDSAAGEIRDASLVGRSRGTTGALAFVPSRVSRVSHKPKSSPASSADAVRAATAAPGSSQTKDKLWRPDLDGKHMRPKTSSASDAKRPKRKKKRQIPSTSNSTSAASTSPARRRRLKPNPFAKALAARPSIMDRATRSKTSEMISKLVEKKRGADTPATQEDTSGGAATANAGDSGQTASGRGIKLLLRITEESNEMTRKVERQKRILERQNEQAADLERKVEQARKRLGMLLKSDRGMRRGMPKREGYIVRLDALHTRLNEATTHDTVLREQINELRLQQLDDFALQRELAGVRMQLEEAQKDILQQVAAAREREEALRLQAKDIAEKSSAIVSELKEEWDVLSIFVNAKTEKERERLWSERKKQEVRVAEEERQRQEEAKKAIMQLSPFGSVLLKHNQQQGEVQGSGGRSHRFGSGDGKESNQYSSDKSRDSTQHARRRSSHETKLRQTLAGGLHGKLLHSDSLNDLALAGNLTVNEEKALKTNIQQSRWQIARGQVALHTLEGKANSLEQGFELIKAKSGIDSPAEMVEVFLQREEEIFRLFTHVNLLSEQIEELESSVEMEREEIERFKGKDGDTSQGRSILRQLDERLQVLQRRTVRHEETGTQASRLVDRVKASVASLFVRIGCDTKLIDNFVIHNGAHASFSVPGQQQQQQQEQEQQKQQQQQQHSGADCAKPRNKRRYKSPESERAAAEAETISMKKYEITEKNLLQYIGVIEQRVSELLLLYSIATRQKPTETAYYKQQQALQQQAIQAQIYHLQRLPSVATSSGGGWSDEDDEDEDGDDSGLRASGSRPSAGDGSNPKPLSHQELLRRIMAQEGHTTSR